MKLLIQSDDYGITEGVSAGILYAIESGIVRNTGLFSNMDCAEKVVKWIHPFLKTISFGIDLNLCAGYPCSDINQIPTLTQKNGRFLTSKMHRINEGITSMKYEEILLEYVNQVERFIQIVGKKPDYLHGHAYQNKLTDKAMEEISKMYTIPIGLKLLEKNSFKTNGMSWYPNITKEINVLDYDTISYFINDEAKILESDKSFILTHCGFIDTKIHQLSSYTLIRAKDLEAMTSSEVKEWIKANNIELITYNDLK